MLFDSVFLIYFFVSLACSSLLAGVVLAVLEVGIGLYLLYGTLTAGRSSSLSSIIAL